MIEAFPGGHFRAEHPWGRVLVNSRFFVLRSPGFLLSLPLQLCWGSAIASYAFILCSCVSLLRTFLSRVRTVSLHFSAHGIGLHSVYLSVCVPEDGILVHGLSGSVCAAIRCISMLLPWRGDHLLSPAQWLLCRQSCVCVCVCVCVFVFFYVSCALDNGPAKVSLFLLLTL